MSIISVDYIIKFFHNMAFNIYDLYTIWSNNMLLCITVLLIPITILFVLKDCMQGEKFQKRAWIEKKVVIVTGANSGIGKETARELAARGAKVYLLCRDLYQCEEVRKELILDTLSITIYCEQCDLSSLESIRQFVDKFKKEEQKVDILINNAGVLACPLRYTEDGIEMHLGVNHIGHFLLTNLLLDLLRNSKHSRIINVSSEAHTRGEINTDDLNSEKSYNRLKAYYQSKLANILFTRELAKRLEGTNVTVNALHPGFVDTNIFRHLKLCNIIHAKHFIKLFLWPFMKTPQSGAQTTLFAALDPFLEKVTGMYFSNCKLAEVAPAAKDDTKAKWLWEISEKWTKLKIINESNDNNLGKKFE